MRGGGVSWWRWPNRRGLAALDPERLGAGDATRRGEPVLRGELVSCVRTFFITAALSGRFGGGSRHGLALMSARSRALRTRIWSGVSGWCTLVTFLADPAHPGRFGVRLGLELRSTMGLVLFVEMGMVVSRRGFVGAAGFLAGLWAREEPCARFARDRSSRGTGLCLAGDAASCLLPLLATSGLSTDAVIQGRAYDAVRCVVFSTFALASFFALRASFFSFISCSRIICAMKSSEDIGAAGALGCLSLASCLRLPEGAAHAPLAFFGSREFLATSDPEDAWRVPAVSATPSDLFEPPSRGSDASSGSNSCSASTVSSSEYCSCSRSHSRSRCDCCASGLLSRSSPCSSWASASWNSSSSSSSAFCMWAGFSKSTNMNCCSR
mmetsp:Transcript_1919/g.3558  ORF Transcript_1919/g.3558 Transcript_1919/m.3558 type:complete len:381 (+) Transcript_1919:2063-3205(+)